MELTERCMKILAMMLVVVACLLGGCEANHDAAATAEASQIRVVMIGDSLTRGTYGNFGATKYVSYANRLARERSEVLVDALDGTTSAHWLQIFPGQALRPDIAFVMLGTNDARDPVPPGEVVANLKKLREMIGCKVIFLTPPINLDQRWNVVLRQYAAAMKEAFGDDCLDLTTLNISADAYFDGLHMLSKGQDIIYAVVKKKLEEVTYP